MSEPNKALIHAWSRIDKLEWQIREHKALLRTLEHCACSQCDPEYAEFCPYCGFKTHADDCRLNKLINEEI